MPSRTQRNAQEKSILINIAWLYAKIIQETNKTNNNIALYNMKLNTLPPDWRAQDSEEFINQVTSMILEGSILSDIYQNLIQQDILNIYKQNLCKTLRMEQQIDEKITILQQEELALLNHQADVF